MDILNLLLKIELQATRGYLGEQNRMSRQSEKERGRGRGEREEEEEASPVYFIQRQQSTIHNQARLIHSFN